MPFYTVVGGVPSREFNILWSGEPPVTADEIEKQVESARGLDLPTVKGHIGSVPSNCRKLAVVGGGPSINDHIEALKHWDGDIWSINGAYHWCRTRGIDTTFIACDPHVIVADWALNVKKALVTTRCHERVFKVLMASGADVRVFDLDGGNKVLAGSSTATAAIHLAVLDGYKDITFFGCESSYPPGVTHAYMHEVRPAEIIVQVGDGEYYTAPDFLMQAIELSGVIRAADGLREESGGLLRALIKTPEYRVTWISEGLLDTLKPIEVAG